MRANLHFNAVGLIYKSADGGNFKGRFTVSFYAGTAADPGHWKSGQQGRA